MSIVDSTRRMGIVSTFFQMELKRLEFEKLKCQTFANNEKKCAQDSIHSRTINVQNF